MVFGKICHNFSKKVNKLHFLGAFQLLIYLVLNDIFIIFSKSEIAKTASIISVVLVIFHFSLLSFVGMSSRVEVFTQIALRRSLVALKTHGLYHSEENI